MTKKPRPRKERKPQKKNQGPEKANEISEAAAVTDPETWAADITGAWRVAAAGMGLSSVSGSSNARRLRSQRL